MYSTSINFDADLFPGYFSRNVSRGSSFPLTAVKTFIFTTKSTNSEIPEENTDETAERPPKRQKISNEAAEDTTEQKKTKFECKVCHKTMTSEKDFNLHVNSKAHHFKVKLEAKWKATLEEEKGDVNTTL